MGEEMTHTATGTGDRPETAVVERARKLIGGSGAVLAELGEAAVERFESLGFPGRKDEMFTFVNTREIVSAILEGEPAEPAEISEEFVRSMIYAGLEKSVVVMVNGFYSERLSDLSALGGAARVRKLEKIGAGSETQKYLLDDAAKETDPFASLNGVFSMDGVVIEIDEGAALPAPLQILCVNEGDGGKRPIAAPRMVVEAGEGSRAQVIMKQTGRGAYIADSSAHILAGRNSEISLVHVQADPSGALNLSKTRVTQRGGSSLRAILAFSGGQTARGVFEARLAEEGASLELDGVSILKGREQAHHYARVFHDAPGCSSRQLFRNIVADGARVSVDGTVIVGRGARLTDSNQLINNLMLSDDAVVDIKPNLMIYADDVKCSHGATVGQVDEDQLFYLRTRGFTEAAAKALLIRSFARTVMDRIEHEPVAEDAAAILLGKLEAENA